MKKTTMLLIGGFLGAGKTTLLTRAANCLTAQGKKVGLITNDQAPDMVDTCSIQQRGLAVREVAGSCFCCNFNALIDVMESLRHEEGAEVILAESVGSCTDLSATIMQPLKDKYAQWYDLRPVSVVLDPLRLTEIYPKLSFQCLCAGAPRTRLHESAGYIVRKQMEEADILLINKKDLLSDQEREALAALLARDYPQAALFSISAAGDDGVEAWLAKILSMSGAGMRLAEVDYDIYAEGEAVLGWLNAALSLHASDGSGQWKDFSRKLMAELGAAFDREQADTGHLKLIITAASGSIRGNLIRTAARPDVRGEIPASVADVEMLINARVEMSPERLEQIVREVLAATCGQFHVNCDIRGLKSLSPGRPMPTMRYDRIIHG